ncbi:glycosyltransferase family 9 protein [Spongiactinospora rosea]|uniref:Glycosyltransferase family 9 protein n=1 Tax=Spongiactinospora rosea TaxID=2248750 RepID=A0A366LX73_9ACTN|nr:glycosyltransferase family 9 protein [Spongiactinospora rosea]RBQ17959.1 glycosyltransferase family 9 protein [Spongiactinospora rosea]
MTAPREETRREKVLVARTDNAGDVLLAGPAIRAVAARAEVVLLAGPHGSTAARLLPGVSEIITWRAPWIDPEPPPVTHEHVDELLTAVRRAAPATAVILTSFHQSALPLALLLRLAGVPRIAAISNDYPGSLLDHRHVVDEDADVPEPVRMLTLATAAGFPLPQGDDGRLAVRRPLPAVGGLTGPPGYVVVHPGVTAPARGWPPDLCAQAVTALTRAGHRVVVTGTPGERALTAHVAGTDARDLGGATTLAELAAVLAGAAALVAPNTGPAHLAAAVGTPVVSLFAPVVPAARWAPYGVPVELLGDQRAPCRSTRARICPIPGHPCLSSVTADDVVTAVHRLTAHRPAALEEAIL